MAKILVVEDDLVISGGITDFLEGERHIVDEVADGNDGLHRVRYYDYYQQPAVLAENYAPMTGYYWVAGQWAWNGYEWKWTAGHYEPDPSYVEPSYDYNNGYSNSGGYYDPNCDHDRY